MRRGARLTFAVRWVNRDTGKRGTIPRSKDDRRPREVPYLPALEMIDAWRDRKPSVTMWTEARA